MPFVPPRHGLGSAVFFTEEENLILPQNPRSGGCRDFLGDHLIHASLFTEEKATNQREFTSTFVWGPPAVLDPGLMSPNISANVSTIL